MGIAEDIKSGFNNFFEDTDKLMNKLLAGITPDQILMILGAMAAALIYLDPQVRKMPNTYAMVVGAVGAGLTGYFWIEKKYTWALQIGAASMLAYSAMMDPFVNKIINKTSGAAGGAIGAANKNHKPLTAPFQAPALGGKGSNRNLLWLIFLPGALFPLLGFLALRTEGGRVAVARVLGTSPELLDVTDKQITRNSALRTEMEKAGVPTAEIDRALDGMEEVQIENMGLMERVKTIGGDIAQKYLKKKAQDTDNQEQKFEDALENADQPDAESSISEFTEADIAENKSWADSARDFIAGRG